MRGGQEQQKKGKNTPPPNFMGRAQPCQPAPGSTVHCRATERPRFSTSQYQTSCSSSEKSGAHQGPSKEPGYPPTLAHPEPPGSRWPPSGCRGLAAQHRAAAPQQAPLRASAPGTAPPCAAPTGRRRRGLRTGPRPAASAPAGGRGSRGRGATHEWVH